MEFNATKKQKVQSEGEDGFSGSRMDTQEDHSPKPHIEGGSDQQMTTGEPGGPQKSGQISVPRCDNAGASPVVLPAPQGSGPFGKTSAPPNLLSLNPPPREGPFTHPLAIVLAGMTGYQEVPEAISDALKTILMYTHSLPTLKDENSRDNALTSFGKAVTALKNATSFDSFAVEYHPVPIIATDPARRKTKQLATYVDLARRTSAAIVTVTPTKVTLVSSNYNLTAEREFPAGAYTSPEMVVPASDVDYVASIVSLDEIAARKSKKIYEPRAGASLRDAVVQHMRFGISASEPLALLKQAVVAARLYGGDPKGGFGYRAKLLENVKSYPMGQQLALLTEVVSLTRELTSGTVAANVLEIVPNPLGGTTEKQVRMQVMRSLPMPHNFLDVMHIDSHDSELWSVQRVPPLPNHFRVEPGFTDADTYWAAGLPSTFMDTIRGMKKYVEQREHYNEVNTTLFDDNGGLFKSPPTIEDLPSEARDLAILAILSTANDLLVPGEKKTHIKSIFVPITKIPDGLMNSSLALLYLGLQPRLTVKYKKVWLHFTPTTAPDFQDLGTSLMEASVRLVQTIQNCIEDGTEQLANLVFPGENPYVVRFEAREMANLANGGHHLVDYLAKLKAESEQQYVQKQEKVESTSKKTKIDALLRKKPVVAMASS